MNFTVLWCMSPETTVYIIMFYTFSVSPNVTLEMDNTTVNLLVKNYNLSMKCLPSNADLNYQWHRKNSSLPSSAVGGKTPSLTIYRLTPEDAGEYQCLLSNTSGTIASEFITLKINGRLICLTIKL